MPWSVWMRGAGALSLDRLAGGVNTRVGGGRRVDMGQMVRVNLWSCRDRGTPLGRSLLPRPPMSSVSPIGDAACRYGGDRFVTLLKWMRRRRVSGCAQRGVSVDNSPEIHASTVSKFTPAASITPAQVRPMFLGVIRTEARW